MQPPNQTCPRKNIILHHAKASKNVEKFSGSKEESFKEIPPDNLLLLGGSTPKMVRTKPTRSYPVSRSEICQGGGYDAAIRSATEPEVNPIPYSTRQGANQDICALKMPYLTNQESLNDEANFYGF
ncbi:hypothetical protein F2Q69_00020465 [Brassica cretica]|uniref:Uncharacterized protein n=1 Tax=Brassica cretica TaxID=69181 RepID=A0A8S9QJW7_BRACR|nr:hypothetical protein F2Q69_00020465 [Brassica cretica]